VSDFPKAGEVFAERYELVELLGSGGIGTVFKALQPESGRFIALKVMHPEFSRDDEFRQRFLREARALSQLSHPAIVTVYHIGISEEGLAYMAMELVAGVSLRRLLDTEGRLPALRAASIAIQICDALAYVHRHEIIHRDIKPDNLILVDKPEPDTVKLIDFGLARMSAEQKLTQTGFLVGSVNYMSPEQCRGMSVDARSDIYSVALCFFEMLSGRQAFLSDNPVGLMYKQINEPVPPLKERDVDRFSDSLNKIISRAAAKPTPDRYQTMDDLKNDLVALRQELENVAPSRKGAGLNRFAAGSLIVLVCAALAFTFLIYGSWRCASRQPGPQAGNMVQTGSVQLRRKIDDLLSAVGRQEERYRRAKTPVQKHDAAIQLFNLLLLLSGSQIESQDLSDAEKSLHRAMQLTVVLETGSENLKATVLNQLALCKISARNLREAESLLASADECKGLSPSTRIKLACNRILLLVRAHKFALAAREFSSSIAGKTSPQEGSVGRSPIPLRSTLVGLFARYADEAYVIDEAVMREKLSGSADLTGALAFMNEVNQFLVENRSPSCAKPLLYSLSILKQIPPDAPDFKPVAGRTYRLLARFEQEINDNPEGAGKYWREAEMLNR
jgi:hypothetical protein